MPSYRLLAGNLTVIETFDAEDDAEAITRAHGLALDFPIPECTFAARWGYFRLERQDGHLWQFFFAWVP
ncbi:hypothetical protein [Geodermatophilus sp. DSM 44513]|uniref:hypothetical protein n=1 Tax=Geodermatophilus sp. DSM 44513 TaxID=1528104 RepID=UPI00127B04E0|nr:hypothetical protein [Geodermatophilus sp. DSM 44513]WNV75164.1 hypothetical protein RTG05_19575 [Geodermatophilus sp. DSM 44513]